MTESTRITQLQQAHPFLTEDDARMLLIGRYIATGVSAGLDDYTDELCAKPERSIRKVVEMYKTFGKGDQ